MALYPVEETVTVSRTNSHSLPEHARSIREDASTLVSSVDHAIGDYRLRLGASLRDRPYATLAVAAGAGFVIGGGVATSLTRFLLATGGRLVLALAMKRVGDSLETALGSPLSRPTASEGGIVEVTSARSKGQVG